MGYVARALDQVLGPVDLKTPVWLNALDRVLDSARRSRSLDELLHSGVLEQGRKAKAQAGDLFPAHCTGRIYPLRLPDAARLLPSDARRSQCHS